MGLQRTKRTSLSVEIFCFETESLTAEKSSAAARLHEILCTAFRNKTNMMMRLGAFLKRQQLEKCFAFLNEFAYIGRGSAL